MKSDFFRVCYLLREGGFYVDMDIYCHASLENIFEYQNFGCFMIYAKGNPSCIENGLIVCEPNSFVLKAILDGLLKHLTRPHNFSSVWEYTGPGCFTMDIMYLQLQEIANEGITGGLKDYLKLGVQSLTYKAYNPANELEYKQSAAGNWRTFIMPHNLHEL